MPEEEVALPDEQGDDETVVVPPILDPESNDLGPVIAANNAVEGEEDEDEDEADAAGPEVA